MNREILINAVGFYILWWAQLWGAQSHSPWGLVLGFVLILGHFIYTARTDRRTEIIFVAIFSLSGWAVDCLLHALYLVRFGEGGLPPLWLFVMWLGFAATIRHSMRGLCLLKWWGPFFGFIGGPLTYHAGRKFQVIEFPAPDWRGYLALAMIWAAWMAIYRLALLRGQKNHR